jgi:hypothetical protein
MEQGTIQFKVLSLDDGDGLLNFLFSASNGRFSAAQAILEYVDAFKLFGRSLIGFPAKSEDKPLLEIGSMKGRSAYYISLRPYIFDAVGHSALKLSWTIGARLNTWRTRHSKSIVKLRP